jgi:hypothetical protein
MKSKRAGKPGNSKRTTWSIVTAAQLTNEHFLAAVAYINARARYVPTPEMNGECCMELPGEWRRAEFAFRNPRPLITVTHGVCVTAQDVALRIKLQRPKGLRMTVSHLCGNPRCVNPVHMAEMTQKENKQYGMKFEKEDTEIRAAAERAGRTFGYRTGSEADDVLRKLGYGM